MVLASACYQKCPLRPLVFKTDATLVQTLRLIFLDFSTSNPFSDDRCVYLDASDNESLISLGLPEDFGSIAKKLGRVDF